MMQLYGARKPRPFHGKNSMIRKAFIVLQATVLTHPAASTQFLKVSDNHRFLVTERGDPFFWLGDTGWEMLHRLDRKEMEHYMGNRKGKGYTVIQKRAAR